MQFCKNFGIVLRVDHRQQLQSIIMDEMDKVESLESLLDNGDLQNDLIFVLNVIVINKFSKKIQIPENPHLMKDMNYSKK